MSRGPARYGAGLYVALCTARECVSSRWTAPTASAAAGVASPIPKMPSPPPGLPSPVTLMARPRPGTEMSRPCGSFGWRAPRLAKRGPRRSTKYAQSRSPPPPMTPKASCGGTLNVYRLLERCSVYRPGSGSRPSNADQVHLASPRPACPVPRGRGGRAATHTSSHTWLTPPPNWWPESASASRPHQRCSSLSATTPTPRPRSELRPLCGMSPIDAISRQHLTASTAAATEKPTARCGRSPSCACATTPTPAYIQRRTKEGHSKKAAFRCLKRYIAREVYNHLPRPHLALDSP